MERKRVQCNCGAWIIARTPGNRCELCKEWYHRQRYAGIPANKRIERADMEKLRNSGQDVSGLIAYVYANDGVD